MLLRSCAGPLWRPREAPDRSIPAGSGLVRTAGDLWALPRYFVHKYHLSVEPGGGPWGAPGAPKWAGVLPSLPMAQIWRALGWARPPRTPKGDLWPLPTGTDLVTARFPWGAHFGGPNEHLTSAECLVGPVLRHRGHGVTQGGGWVRLGAIAGQNRSPKFEISLLAWLFYFICAAEQLHGRARVFSP